MNDAELLKSIFFEPMGGMNSIEDENSLNLNNDLNIMKSSYQLQEEMTHKPET